MVQGIQYEGNNQEIASAMHVQIRESWIEHIRMIHRERTGTDIREHLLSDAIPLLPMAKDVYSGGCKLTFRVCSVTWRIRTFHPVPSSRSLESRPRTY